ncbi:uncharacterized protein LOC129225895 [Uloborus diversus]|uniref:uncharacterized protein LOC129225895 n=1 Tax=Uloborus diversus TaxID=327109 RepID=UPI002409C8B7|nr:uncharacterized protein LOC129225895 [Uloborus diversus]
MATYTNFSELLVTETTTEIPDAVKTTVVNSAPMPPFFRLPTTTLSPGHAAILEMHANSQSNAIMYVVIVLSLYILGMTVVVIKYIRTERYEARLTRLFHDLVQRDRFFRLSRRRSSLPKCVPEPPSAVNEDDLPLSPTIVTPEANGPIEIESKL